MDVTSNEAAVLVGGVNREIVMMRLKTALQI